MTLKMSARAALVALLSAAIALPPMAVPASPASAAGPAGVGECRNGWQELIIPDASLGHIPMGAITHDGELRWIIGGGRGGPLALKWTGERLVARDLGNELRRGLSAGVPHAGQRALAAGYQRPSRGSPISPFLGRLDGAAFRPDPVDFPRRTNAATADLISLPKGRGWAVGSYLSNGRWRALALKRIDGRWRRADPASAGRSSGLLGVAQAPGGAIWAAGWRDIDSVIRPLLVKRTPKGWKASTGAPVPAGPAALTDVTFAPSGKGWAIGYLRRGGSERHTPILERLESRQWRRVALPWDDASAIPQSVAVAADGDLWIAGTQLANAEREARGFVARRHEGDWSMRFLDTPPDIASGLHSVDATNDGVVLTGTIASTALVLRSCVAVGPADKSRRISIAGVRKRARRVERHVLEETMPLIAPAGVNVRLARPVPPSGFRIRDVAAEAGVGETTRTYGALAADLDGDGWKDLFISRHQGSPMLALGGPGGFTILPNTAFSSSDRHACDVADVDKDGHKDILCVTGRRYGTRIARHELSLEPAGPDPRLDRTTLGIADPLGRGRELAFIKLDGDAYPEVFIANQPEREDAYLGTNRFYRNDDGHFVPAPEVGLDRPVGGFCAKGVDVDGDGDDDLLHCARYPYDGRPPGLRIYRNVAGVLKERSAALGVAPIGDIDVTMADIDGDGRRDLVQLSGNRLRVSRRTNDGFRRIYQAIIEKSVAVAAGDVDGDGRDDLYVVRGGPDANLSDRLLVNDGDGRSFTSVKIPQAGPANGRGDDVVAIDHDRNGLTDFLVLNGRGAKPGPIQLLAAFEAAP